MVINKETGILRAGHGRLQAAKKLKQKTIPVVYQEFKDADQDYAFMVSDNAIGHQSELDFSGINLDIENLGPDIDIELIGIKNFTIDPFEKEPEVKVESFNEKIITCPECNHSFVMPKGGK